MDKIRRFLVIKPFNEVMYPYANKRFNKKYPVGSIVEMKPGDYIDRKVVLDSEIRECLRELKSENKCL